MKPDLSNSPKMTSTVNYMKRADVQPRIYQMGPPPGEPMSTIETDPHEMLIHDVRGIEDQFDLHRDGCCFLKDRIDPFHDYEDRRAVVKEFYPVIQALAQDILQVEDIRVTDFGIRRRSHGLESNEDNSGPTMNRKVADVAHADFTPYSASLPVAWRWKEEGERLVRGHYAMYNFWWPLRGPLRDYPLALCLPRSTAGEDYQDFQSYFDTRGPTPVWGFCHHPSHEWIYKSAMEEPEITMFRTWESRLPVDDMVAHVAVKDPEVGPDVLPRESAEARVVVFYPD